MITIAQVIWPTVNQCGKNPANIKKYEVEYSCSVPIQPSNLTVPKGMLFTSLGVLTEFNYCPLFGYGLMYLLLRFSMATSSPVNTS